MRGCLYNFLGVLGALTDGEPTCGIVLIQLIQRSLSLRSYRHRAYIPDCGYTTLNRFALLQTQS